MDELISPVYWARLGVLSVFIAKRLRIMQPPVLILSLPRSGSSWVGEILGSAANALYLREPMTQSNLALGAERPLFYIDHDTPSPIYQRFADMAFSGLPNFQHGVVYNPKEWSLLRRRKKRLVIKEVNPIICEWLLKRYKPKVIFLVRHPVAVALSYLKRGWVNIEIKKILLDNQHMIDGHLRFWKEYLKSIPSDFWVLHGSMQGAILRIVRGNLTTYVDHRIILYEDLCANPIKGFLDLFDFTGLCWDEKIRTLIIEKSINGNGDNPYSTARDSKKMINSWKDKISKEELNRLKAAYSIFDLPWYNSPDSW